MINYSMNVAICWVIFLLIYVLFLRGLTHFQWNRIYLLCTLILGIILPSVSLLFSYASGIDPLFHVTLPAVTITEESNGIFGTTAKVFSWLSVVYVIGFVSLLFRFVLGLTQIYRLFKQGVKEKQAGYTLIRTKNRNHTFSFFRFIFIAGKDRNTTSDQLILDHELEHMQKGHSYDLILLQLLRIIFWFNPLVYIYQSYIREVHEFEADGRFITPINKRLYLDLLLGVDPKPNLLSLVNPFYNSKIKSRIMMMMKSPSNNTSKSRYLLLLPALILSVFLQIQCEDTYQAKSDELTVIAAGNKRAEPVQHESWKDVTERLNNEKVYQEVDVKPHFPGCEDVMDAEEKSNCQNQKMLEYIYTHIKYPAEARKAGDEGTVLSKMIITKSGTVENVRIVKSDASSLNTAVMEMFDLMKADIQWVPGTKNGKPVNVEFTLPVKFKLE